MAVEPFRVSIPDSALDDLRHRPEIARWPDQLPDTDWSYGIPVDRVRHLAERWAGDFDWREQERDLNRYPQFVTEIDGRRLHFVHVRSTEPNALPLVLVHGWPFSDFRSVIDPLVDPGAHGGDPATAVDLVIPTLPGFGFSGPTRHAGEASTERTAQLITELMDRLGYRRYAMHGGDAGSFIAPEVGRLDPEHVAGVHLNGPITVPGRDEDGSGFDDRDAELLRQMQDWSRQDTSAYAAIHGGRPQTLAYGLHDSPVGLAAWVGDIVNSYAHEPIDDDALLTNLSVLWFTATIGSSLRLYRESQVWGATPTRSKVPTAIAVFPGDRTIRAIAERQNTVVRWTSYDRGGHFPALEAPDLLIKDLREFRKLLSQP